MSLEVIRSPLLKPFTHGFFTRKGGASSGVFAGLNCGFGSSDQKEVVALNRARVEEEIGVPHGALVTVHQVHSPDVVTVKAPGRSDVRADGLVTDRPGLALGILTADCEPVLFADAEAQVIGAAHAGWKGAIGGVLEATVDRMEALGADRSRIQALIGPSISQRAYEVGPDFMDTFLAEDPDTARFFAGGREDRVQFDLPSYGLSRLRAAGVSAEWTGHCTYSDPARFYSYRRSVHRKEADYGRLISVIRI
ncbi:MAG: peptidoglycan editing factor PgeF [Shimia sp.]